MADLSIEIELSSEIEFESGKECLERCSRCKAAGGILNQRCKAGKELSLS
jgi:hypothetical protein